MERVRLLSTTVVLTVLIWASADSLVNESAFVGVSFEVTPLAADSEMISTVEARAATYELEIFGPRKTIEDVQAEEPLKIRLRLPERPTGLAEIQLERSMLEQALVEQGREFRKLSILSVQPDILPVDVDHIVSKDVELVYNGRTLAYDVEPQLERTAVTVRMRESYYNSLPGSQSLQLDIGPDLERLLAEQPLGKSVDVRVALDASAFGPDADVAPGTVNVTATVQAQRVTEQISTVPILLAVSFANLERPLRPVRRDGSPASLVTQTISVTGLREDVARLQRGETRAYGIVQLKQEDLEELDVLKLVTPEYHLPEAIELAENPNPIEFKLIIATEAELGGEAGLSNP